ncbi:MAG TPA: immunoglobulin domain-containing protein [Opitutaceae bacterium]
MRRFLPAVLGVAAALALASVNAAPSVVADFNDCAPGTLQPGKTNNQPADTGIGFSDPYWLGATAVPTIVTGDLTAPAATRYAATQSGAAQRLQPRGATAQRQHYRGLAAPLSGVVWGSFLIQQTDTNTHKTGLTFNVADIDPLKKAGQGRLYAAGSSLLIHGWNETSPVLVTNCFVAATTSLVLFRLDSATKQLDVWVDPVLPDSVAALSTGTAAYSGTCDLVGSSGSIATIGVGGYPDSGTAANCGYVDSIRLSSGAYGYYDVTGLPAVPLIAAQPASRTVAEGSSVSFEVTATGEGTLAYQWQKDGVELPGATSNPLTLAAVAESDAGAYRVVVRDTVSSGVTVSEAASLTVLGTVMPVTITAHPLSQAVAVGAPVQFSVTATGTSPITYQWQKNGAAIDGATGTELALASARLSDAGAYTVVMTNPAGSVTSDPGTLSVSAPPQIVASPQNAESYVGGTATFRVEATGSDLVYRWTHDGDTIAGASAATLLLTNLQVGDAGVYQVIVSNALGAVTADAASLSVSPDAPPASGQAPAAADGFIGNGSRAAETHDGQGLLVGARSAAAGAYKSFLSFELPLAVKAADATSAAVTLTLDLAEPFLGASSAPTESTLATVAAMRIRKGYDSVTQTVLTVGPAVAGTDIHRSLLTFDLSSLAFAPETLKLRLSISGKWPSALSGPQTLRLYRVTKDWVQNQANWDRASTSAAWTTPGGDFSPAVLSEVVANPATVAAGDPLTFPDTPEFRQALLEVLDTDGLLRLIVVAGGEDTGTNQVFQFHPRGTAGLEPVLVFPPGSVANNAPKNPVRLRLHGIVNNADTWDETNLTWNNAPVRAEALTSVGAGAVPLAELALDAGALAGGTSVTFADPRIAQFLNWAAGRRGDWYGFGAESDADRRVTFAITSLDGGDIFAGIRFVDKETAPAGAAPVLGFDTTGAAATAARELENERFRVVLRDDLALDITDKTTSATSRFAAAFEVVSQTASPGFGRKYLDTNPASIWVATWSSNHNYGAAAGERKALQPVSARAWDGQFAWDYAPASAAFGFRATLDLPAGTEFPRLRWTLSPSARRYFAVACTPVAARVNADVTSFYLPGIWDGRRFPDNQYVIDETRATLPGVFREAGGVVSGLAVDAFELPNRVATFVNSAFGLCTNDPTATQNQPAVIAPLYGSVGSQTDGTQNFAVRLVVGGAGLDRTFRDLATGVYGFRDYRENLAGGSLNTALDNLVDFVLNTSGENYSYWRDNTKANEYVNDEPEYVRFQSAPTALALAMMRDDAELYERRARPSIEYFISRRNQMMKFDGYDPAYPMGGPVTAYYGTDFFALYGLTGGRTQAFVPLAEEARAVSNGVTPLASVVTAGVSLSRGDTYDRMFDTLHSLIEGYRATGTAEYLADARWLTDEYLRHRYEGGAPTDFRDVKSSFWNQLGGRWESLLEMEDITGDTRYATAAARAADEFIRHINFGPALSDLTVDGLGSPVKASLVSEVGLTSESSASSVSHRGIFMSAYAAPSLTRVARQQNDPFYAAVARSSVIGRWLNYPGYTIRNNYNPAFLRADYPLRWYPAYENTAHMNHPLPLAAMAIDFLLADAERKSALAIKFPHHFTDSRGYFRGRLFGDRPGVFYGDTGVWPWLPRALVSLSGDDAVQLNYLAGHGNGRLYLAFSNQSQKTVEAVVTVNASRVALTAGARLRVWRDNVAQAEGTFTNGVTTVTVAPGGFTALAIDAAEPVLGLQADYRDGFGAPLTGASYDKRSAPFGRLVGTILSLSPARQHAYVYTDAAPTTLSAARLRYRIDGGAEQVATKAEFPFEFTVALREEARTFAYVLEGTPAAGGDPLASDEVTLKLDTTPLVTEQPAGRNVTAGGAVTFSATVVGTGPFTYQWRKDGVAIAGATSATFTIASVTDDDAGSYDVVVTNAAGSVTSAAAMLTVTMPGTWPVITSMDHTTFTIGLECRFTVLATGDPAPTFSASGLPSWVKLDGATGVLSGTPPAGTVPAALPVTVTASNGVRPIATQAFTLKVEPAPVAAATLEISTFAGTPGLSGGSDGAQATFSSPLGVSADLAGNVYVCDSSNHTIRKIAGGLTSTLAGAAGNPGSADGQGAAARFSFPSGLAADSAGNLYVADTVNHTIRKITSSGAVSTLAGQAGISGGADGTGDDARFHGPQGVALNASGTRLFVADTNNHAIREIDLSTGAVVTVAGLAGRAGSADGPGENARFHAPSDLALDAQDRIYIVDTENNALRLVTPAGVVSTMAGLAGSAGAADGTGAEARFNEPSAVALDDAGAAYVVDSDSHTIRRVDLVTGAVTTLAGLAGASGYIDGEAAAARFLYPAGLTLAADEGLLIADTSNQTLRVGRFFGVPVILTQPQSQAVASGAGIQFSVTGSGRPAVSYQWHFNGAPIPGATGSSHAIASVQPSHAGDYTVVLSNRLGSATSNAARLTVNGVTPPPPEPGAGGGSGGGAVSAWGLLALALLGAARDARRQAAEKSV